MFLVVIPDYSGVASAQLENLVLSAVEVDLQHVAQFLTQCR